MKIENIPLGFNKISYDEFTWSDNNKVNSSNKILISVPINKEQLKNLSITIYRNYMEVIKDVPDYFENWDEPFPDNENEIYNNPKILLSYFSKSSLWSDFLIKTISKIQDWDMSNSKYHVLNVNDVKESDNTIYIVMMCIKLIK